MSYLTLDHGKEDTILLQKVKSGGSGLDEQMDYIFENLLRQDELGEKLFVVLFSVDENLFLKVLKENMAKNNFHAKIDVDYFTDIPVFHGDDTMPKILHIIPMFILKLEDATQSA